MNVPSKGRKFAHVGLAVADLEQAIEFYKVFLDTEPIGTYENDRVPFIDELVGYEAKMKEVWFELGDGFIELLQYSEPEPGRIDPETYNTGHMHLCLEVEDVDAEYARLRDADLGIEFRSEGPVKVPEDVPDFGGDRYLYLRTPDGSTFELFTPAPAASAPIL
jgi:catechol 2,3-dioxygenase-like lactoylglutathione lyase family enzyme